MTLVMYVVVTAIATTILLAGIAYLVRAYVRYRDSRLIICPQNNEAAIVEVDAVHAALTSTFGDPDVRLQGCWRWPIHQACGQECLVQLDVAAPECLVHGVLMRWYESKACVVCGKPFVRLHLLDNEPALRDPKGRLMTWNELTPANLHATLADCEPVCWVCYVAASFIAATVRKENYHDARNFDVEVS